MELIVEDMNAPPGERPVEVVERKGLGHPDTICDALAEEVSRALSRHYLERFGQVLHHNVDKILLCGGSATPRFGGGEVTAPIEIILAGRATNSFGNATIPVEAIAAESCRSWLRTHLHALAVDRQVRIDCRFRPGSQDLVDVFRRGDNRIPLANDTSIGVGFAPLSPLEQTVLDVERALNDPSTKRARPEIGEDIKVMGTRRGTATDLTVACALVSAFVESASDYLSKSGRLKEEIARQAATGLGGQIEVALNAADDPSRESFYLTVTGTSAEAGDDGEVGRGNRVNGLITPGRPMTLEAAAGKNPVSHVGKLYNVAAGLIARDLASTLPDVTEAECLLVSRIGAPIDQPQIVSIRLRTQDGRPASAHSGAASEIVRGGLSGLTALSERLVDGEISVY
jgi:S-adenosylmethionine synthetase